ncbi:hypothetical protein HNR65_000645 [Desulfosalsimonas propionicica]|uniref:DUF4301 domain-containing protein n=1 Tax=Desulfosalsimonas propionicica TaxID=332175 RepID=A0A7W0HJQ5_9BACT|nr:DUF4301 family protein [Desulfosalsimonas propionicica]MBA2880338.1 hypothetical protein [Desulfosalsimonas propionicica]
MKRTQWSSKDLEQIREHGLSEQVVEEQVAVFEKGAPYAELDRPCTVGDGIKRLGDEDLDEYIRAFEKAVSRREAVKFVPASGAATRMFKALLQISHSHSPVEYAEICAKGQKEGGVYAEACSFMDQVQQFAFYEDLAQKMGKDGLDAAELRKQGDFTQIFEYLLTDKGLDYASTPKGLILFHKYPDGARTAFEEHLVEAAAYAKDQDSRCRLHLTVSPEHRSGFEALLRARRRDYEQAYNAAYDVGFSQQSPATDTIAVDMGNRPFRDSDGRLVFRPGGHGALIDNLNALDADLVFIKNIDNVVPDRLKNETFRWKKALAGYLVKLEKQIRRFQEQLAGDSPRNPDLDEAAEFVEDQLGVRLPDYFRNASSDRKKAFLTDRLHRPLRVCGMVPSTGEPGGGPFWVKDKEGGASIQIVESAQIDPDSPRQQEIAKALTHFNPVDIVASLRDANNRPFDLHRYVDDQAVFISVKSKDGRELKALEHPGLWNGAMAGWNTVFVEVPLITFNPVKTVNDLLRREHQG